MGLIWSRWKKKQSTTEVLESLHEEIERLESLKGRNQQLQKKFIASLLLYSILIYVLFAILLYFYYLPEKWRDRLIYSLPLLLFPLLIWLAKRFLHWYFVKRITKNDSALEELKDKKKTILDEVMEKETYKKAKEILEKYDPQQLKGLEANGGEMSPVKTPKGQEVRHRSQAQTQSAVKQSVAQSIQHGYPVELPLRDPGLRPVQSPGMPLDTIQHGYPVELSPRDPGLRPVQSPGMPLDTPLRPMHRPMPGRPPGPPLPRPVPQLSRSTADKLIEYLVGDGPQNRYALICSQCKSHNGMALKEEFEFLSYRCCYCYFFNEARKKKPFAPKIELETPIPNVDTGSGQETPSSESESDIFRESENESSRSRPDSTPTSFEESETKSDATKKTD